VEAPEAAERREHLRRRPSEPPAERRRAPVDALNLGRAVTAGDHEGRADRDEHAELAPVALRARRHASERVEGTGEEVHRLGVRIAPERVLGGERQIPRRALGVATALEMQCQLGGDLARLVRPGGLLRFAEQAMEARSSRGGQTSVEELLVEHVNEGVAPARRAPRSRVEPRGFDEVGALAERLEPGVHVVGVDTECRGERAGRELSPRHARRLEQPLIFFGEAFDLLLDQMA
jgi:hypothetical protein